ncbi:hypothetical protein CEP54_003197 [Fusarium duplospermum]|uniref:Uncharacterized protein n=1 Tax=Fusarium duplospermum TaxID=1325734 RepID=A0A428QQI6_9HYPO|nr:hypothetical protein CEP54_003197 [Fusarium duplospermum]
MDNFTSSFLGNSRLTLDTELRVGMSSNARSSAYAGEEIGDLRFNEMRFLEKPEEPPKRHRARNSKVARQEDIRNSLDRHIVQHSSSRQSTPAPSTITSRSVGSRRQASRPQEAESKSQHHGSWRCGSRDMTSKTYYDYMLDKSSSLPQRGRSGSINQAVSIQGSKTSECVPEELIETGVFSGTRFESRLRNRREYSSTATNTNNYRPGPAETSKPHPHPRSLYEDKGVMVSPGVEKSQRSNQKPPVTLDHNPQGIAAGTPTSMNPSTLEQQPNEVSMSNGDPNPVEVIDNPSTSEAPHCVDSRVQATGDEEYQGFNCPVTAQTNKAPRAGKRPESISETSEGGHHYIRCASQDLDLGIGPESSLWKDRPTVQPLPQRVSTPQSWEHGTVHPSQYGWQRYQNTLAPPPNLATRYQESLYPRIFTPIPTPHLVRSEPLNYGQNRFITDEKGPGVVRQNNDEETLMEFITRVESEIMGRWDQSHDSSGVATGGGNFEDSEIARPASRNPRPLRRQREHSVRGVDWDTHLNPPRRFSGRTATDEDCAAAEAEMRAFWRPNPF